MNKILVKAVSIIAVANLLFFYAMSKSYLSPPTITMVFLAILFVSGLAAVIKAGGDGWNIFDYLASLIFISGLMHSFMATLMISAGFISSTAFFLLLALIIIRGVPKIKFFWWVHFAVIILIWWRWKCIAP